MVMYVRYETAAILCVVFCSFLFFEQGEGGAGRGGADHFGFGLGGDARWCRCRVDGVFVGRRRRQVLFWELFVRCVLCTQIHRQAGERGLWP